MALLAADRLALQHQRDLATIAGGTTSVVLQTALGADPAAISTWYFGVVDGLLARIQSGYAQARRSSTEFLRRHAAMNGVDLTPLPASLSVEQARTALRVTGPVAFKTAIAAGQDEEQAVRSMASQMSGSSQRLVLGGDRDTFERTMLGGRGIVGWRRRLGGKGCGFCAMLASRGAVYVSRQAATVAKDGLRYHDHCHCFAEPLYTREDEPADVRKLQRQWRDVTSGETGEAKARKWRNHWENASPEVRARAGIAETQTARVQQVFGEVHSRLAELGFPPVGRAIGGPGATGAVGGVQPVTVRRALTKAKTAPELADAWAAEMKRITGRDITVDIPTGTSLATGREYAEGVLRGLERFPDAHLTEIRFVDTLGQQEWAQAGNGVIHFNARWANIGNRPALLRGLSADVEGWQQGRIGWSTRGAGTPADVAIHEFGHIIDIDNLGERIHSEVLLRLDALARSAGVDVDTFVAREISAYAGSSSHEIIAEAFADVMLRGDKASFASRAVYDVLEREYRSGGFALTGAPTRFPARASAAGLNTKTVAELRALARERGVTVPTGARKADLVRLLSEEAPTARAPLTGADVYGALPIRDTDTLFEIAEVGRPVAGVPGNLVRDAIADYEGNGHEFVNLALREARGDLDHIPVTPPPGSSVIPSQYSQKRVLDMVRGLDAAMEVSTTDAPVLVYRGIVSPRGIGLPSRDAVGFTWVDPTYQSTSIRQATARKFASSGAGVQMRITVPRGTHAIGVENSSPLLRGEQEILLQRGLTMRVTADRVVNGERILDVEVVPAITRAPATPVQRAAEAARAAQAVKDTKRTLGEALADISELTGNDASARVLAHRAQTLLNPAGPLTDEARKLVAPLARALQTGDAAKIARAAKALETKAGLRRIDAGAKPELIDGRPTLTLDRATQEVTGAADSGRVWLVRPGYKVTVDGREVVIVKAQVQGIPKSTIREAEQKAARAAARERNALIEARTGTARLLAEVDELISKKASTATIRERLDVKLTEPGQLFAGADPAAVKLLRDALESGDPAALRSAVTRAGTKAKVKPISRAGAKTKYDPATMEPVAGDIATGAQVTVVRRGSTLTLPDGKVIQLEKARVTAVAKPVKVDPVVAEARAHARSIVATKQLDSMHSVSPDVLAAMEQQASLVPRTVMQLEGVTPSRIGSSFGKYMPAQNYGSPLSRHLDGLTIHLNENWTRAVDSERYRELVERFNDLVTKGYFSRAATGTDPITYTVSHEFGHHVMRMLSVITHDPGGVHEFLSAANARLLLAALDENLGTSFMARLEKNLFSVAGGRKVVSSDYLDAIVAQYGKKLAKTISGYGGAGRFHETMAEIWALYSVLGDAAPIEIRRIGDLMRRLAEKQAAKGL